jgi:hypothetical protein
VDSLISPCWMLGIWIYPAVVAPNSVLQRDYLGSIDPMPLFTTALDLHGGVLWSGSGELQLQGSIPISHLH